MITHLCCKQQSKILDETKKGAEEVSEQENNKKNKETNAPTVRQGLCASKGSLVFNRSLIRSLLYVYFSRSFYLFMGA